MREKIAILLWALGAHHSFSNIYDSARNIRLEGVVTQFLFVHPHPYLVLDTGTERLSWRAEMDNRIELEDIGITADTFKPGDRVIVSGSPARDKSRTVYMWRLERPADGLLYEQVGGTPGIRYQGAGL